MLKKKFNCPGELCVNLIGGKWRVILLYNLRRGPKRFGELRRLSPGITPTTLTKELKALEAANLIKRSVLGRDRLTGVEYFLTSKGESLKPVLYAMIRWGLANQSDYAIGEFGMASFSRP